MVEKKKGFSTTKHILKNVFGLIFASFAGYAFFMATKDVWKAANLADSNSLIVYWLYGAFVLGVLMVIFATVAILIHIYFLVFTPKIKELYYLEEKTPPISLLTLLKRFFRNG